MYTKIPQRYPIKATHEKFFRYHPKLIFSIPIAMTPDAEPIMSIEPPTPAQNDINSQKVPSHMKFAAYPAASGLSMGYMPIAAATNGTLSTMAESTPKTDAIT